MHGKVEKFRRELAQLREAHKHRDSLLQNRDLVGDEMIAVSAANIIHQSKATADAAEEAVEALLRHLVEAAHG